jgi:hypothetical protein
MSHCFSALIQLIHFRSTPSSLALKLIQEIKTLTFEQGGEILMHVVIITGSISRRGDNEVLSKFWELWCIGMIHWLALAKAYGNNLVLSCSRVHGG